MSEPTVLTTAGNVRGETVNGVHSFKGVPYGATTGGVARFMPPKPAAKWDGVREATAYGPAAFQVRTPRVEGAPILMEAGIGEMSEDCLVLNVWSRGLGDGGKRPVMVWLHGGGMFLGSGDHMAMYDGASLTRRGDVVVVSVNHRLGILGYLHLGGLLGEAYATSGNAGMLDLVLALEWVRDNAEAFGGDPGNVTIFGESGGGMKVSILLAMPAAKGLFHRAIVESGPGLQCLTPEVATQSARDLLAELGIDESRAADLHDVPADRIVEAQDALGKRGGSLLAGGANFSPVVDGLSVPAHPFDPLASPLAAGVPLLIGTNKDEMTLFLMAIPGYRSMDEAAMRERLKAMLTMRLGDQISADGMEGLISAYRRTRPEATPTDLLVAITSDRMRVGSIRLAERKAAASTAPVFMYLFTWESPAFGGLMKSCHILEMPFVFDNVAEPYMLIGDSPERHELAARMSGAWISFARHGDPNHEGLPRWPTYDPEKRATMIFNSECRIENDPAAEERLAWSGVM